VHIQASHWPVPTVCLCPPLVEWFRAIKHRLNWNLRELQKPFDADDANANGKDGVEVETDEIEMGKQYMSTFDDYTGVNQQV
jgi:hypothetical protein